MEPTLSGQMQASIARPDSPRPQTIASEMAQGEINATAEFIAETQHRLDEVQRAIEDHEHALSSLQTRRAMLVASLQQIEKTKAGAAL